MSTQGTTHIDMESVIQYLPRHRVLLCMACPHPTCIPPKGVKTHLREFHRKQFTPDQRTKLAKDVSLARHSVLPPRQVVIPRRQAGPVPGLYVYDGFECNRCHYVCWSEKTMDKKHCRSKHGWVKSRGKNKQFK